MHILDCGSFEAAAWLYETRRCKAVCVLDFASDSEPGGGWRGNQTGTQEESLCRSSSLGHALEKLRYPIPEYGAAHVPKVIVFRGDTGELLSQPFHVGVLAAALRDVGGDGEPDAKQRAHLDRKVKGVLCTMASFGYDGIVLGAWGCGAFGNAPTLVADAFANALGEMVLAPFKEVAFPVLRKPVRAAFEQALHALGPRVVPLAGTSIGGGHGEPASAASFGGPVVPRRGLSAMYGSGASAHPEEVLLEWQECGRLAQAAVRCKQWSEARSLFERCVELRPDWPKGWECLARAAAKEDQQQEPCRQQTIEVAEREATQRLETEAAPQTSAAVVEAAAGVAADMRTTAASVTRALVTAATSSPEPQSIPSASTTASSTRLRSSVKGVKLLPHERKLVDSGTLTDVTHAGATAVWLHAESTPRVAAVVPMINVYRPMGDPECQYLLCHGVLPDTQPYQTIVRGDEGRRYAEKYLRGAKQVDSTPTTVVEFVCPSSLIDELFAMQCKPEDGTLSHGLGNKGGRGLHKFNESLRSHESQYRLVLVKRASTRHR